MAKYDGASFTLQLVLVPVVAFEFPSNCAIFVAMIFCIAYVAWT